MSYPGFAKARADYAEDPTCRACGGTEEVAPNSLMGVVCRGCFEVWIDGPLPDADRTNPEKIGEFSRDAKARGVWPWEKRLRLT